MKTGMSTACFFGRIYNEDALREISGLGIKKAEIFFSAMQEYKPGFVNEIKNICIGEGIEMVSVHALPTQFEPQLFSLHGRQYEEALGIYEDVLKAANRLGAHIYVFHGPVHFKVAKKLQLDMAFVGERVTALAEMAKDYGVALCYENVHWCWYKKPGFAKELVQNCESDNIFFTLDMKQVAQSGYDMMDYIDDMGERLKHVHLCDFIKDDQKGIIPCLPFEGQADWEGLRNKLSDTGYEGHLMLEVYSNNYSDYTQLYDNYKKVESFFG